MADDAAAAAEERRRKAQARKDKISQRGADRLAKITGAAKGDGTEGERFGTGGIAPPASSSRTATAATSLPALAAPSFNPLDDPPEVDISTPSARAGFDSIPSFPSSNADGSMPDMLSALLGGGTGGAGAGPGGLPEQFAQMFGGGAPGSTPIQIQAPRQKTWTDRLLPLVHLISMVSLAFYAVFVLEPRLREGYSTFFNSFSRQSIFGLGQIDWNGWAALGRGKQADASSTMFAKAVEDTWEASGRGVATVQMLYLFLTLELMLQGAAILIFKTRPPIPSLLNNIMPYLPPHIAMYAHTGIKYWTLLGQLIDDLAVLILSIAGFILFSEWKQLEGGKLKID